MSSDQPTSAPLSAAQVADRMGLTTRQLQDLRLRGIGPQIVQRGLSIHYEQADVQEIERHEAMLLVEQVLASERPLTLLRALADLAGFKRSQILQQVSSLPMPDIASPQPEPPAPAPTIPDSPITKSSPAPICPEAIALLQDKQFTPDVTRILRNMKAARQVEAVELMLASSTITVAHAEALLKATPPEQRTDVKPTERDKKTAPIEQIEKLEKEMSQVQEKYQEAESNYGSDLLNLVVAKGYLTKLLANEAVKSYIGRHEPEIPTHLELVVNTVSMEEAVQEQQEADA